MTSRLMSSPSEAPGAAPSWRETFGAVSMITQVKGGIFEATPAMIISRTESRMNRFQLIATSHVA